MASVVTVNDIINLLDEMAPPELAESWDNVGLMLGRRNKPVRKLLLALDMTQETVAQAVAKKADMLITHHPAIFHKLGNVTDADWQQDLLLQLAENGVAVYSAHTNLDCVANGVNSVLAKDCVCRTQMCWILSAASDASASWRSRASYMILQFSSKRLCRPIILP